jgi:hypothetical protein
MYSFEVLKNRITVDIEDDLVKAKDFYKLNGIDLTFNTRVSNLKLSALKANGNDNGQIQYIAPFPLQKVPTIIFFNSNEYEQPKDGYITSNSSTDTISLRVNENDNNTGFIFKAIVHEIMHFIIRDKNKDGFVINDPMDYMLVKEGGKWVGKNYYKNDDPYATDGNYAEAFRLLKSIEPKLDVKQLQRDLKVLGYFKYPFITGVYGSITKASVRALQQATGLVPDGVAGTKTLAKIEELKKKPHSGVLPELEAKASLLIAKCAVAGYLIKITEMYRSQDRQNYLYASGRTYPGPILTYAKKSKHTEGRAFDYCFVGKDPYLKKLPPKEADKILKDIADIAISIGLKPGYYFKKFKDPVHMEI